MTLTTTINGMNNGVDPVQGLGMDYLFTLPGSFNLKDQITITMTDALTGLQTQVGGGYVTGVGLTYLKTFNQKIYGVSGTTLFFCAAGDPMTWNDPKAAGNGFVELSNNVGITDDFQALAIYQGNLACIGKQLTTIEQVDADPANNKQLQVLENIGTVAKLTVRAVGDMDIYMLAKNGVRSIRVRDASNNAIIEDTGTPIDAIIQPLLATLTDDQKAASCGIVEPSNNRYWCYIPNADGSAGSIYVFSYFSKSGVAAWGTYAPTYQVAVNAPGANYSNSVLTYTGITVGQRYYWTPGANEVSALNGSTVLTKAGPFVATATRLIVTGNAATAAFTAALTITTSFVPDKFVVYKGQVYVRAGDNIFLFGGSNNATYDGCGVEFITPYIDSGTPGTKKLFKAIDVAFEGSWSVNGAFDYDVNKYRNIYNNSVSSFTGAGVPWEVTGTHYSFQCVETGTGYARFASLLCHQNSGSSKS